MSIHNSKQIENVKVMLLKGDKGQDGITIESIEKTGSIGLEDIYTITFTDGSKTTFTISNGDSIQSIAKTGSSGLDDIYTITMVSGATSTFTVTNGNGIESIEKTATQGNVDTYTVTLTDGTTTTFTVTNANTVVLEQNFAKVESSTTASKTYQVGEFLVLNEQLYKVTQAIAQGGTITVGVNVTAKSVGDELKDLSLSYIGTAQDTQSFSGNLSQYKELIIIMTPYKNASSKIFSTFTLATDFFSRVSSSIVLPHDISSDGIFAVRTTVTSNSVSIASSGSSPTNPQCWIYGRK